MIRTDGNPTVASPEPELDAYLSAFRKRNRDREARRERRLRNQLEAEKKFQRA